jgi:hypothetical protein
MSNNNSNRRLADPPSIKRAKWNQWTEENYDALDLPVAAAAAAAPLNQQEQENRERAEVAAMRAEAKAADEARTYAAFAERMKVAQEDAAAAEHARRWARWRRPSVPASVAESRRRIVGSPSAVRLGIARRAAAARSAAEPLAIAPPLAVPEVGTNAINEQAESNNSHYLELAETHGGFLTAKEALRKIVAEAGVAKFGVRESSETAIKRSFGSDIAAIVRNRPSEKTRFLIDLLIMVAFNLEKSLYGTSSDNSMIVKVAIDMFIKARDSVRKALLEGTELNETLEANVLRSASATANLMRISPFFPTANVLSREDFVQSSRNDKREKNLKRMIMKTIKEGKSEDNEMNENEQDEKVEGDNIFFDDDDINYLYQENPVDEQEKEIIEDVLEQESVPLDYGENKPEANLIAQATSIVGSVCGSTLDKSGASAATPPRGNSASASILGSPIKTSQQLLPGSPRNNAAYGLSQPPPPPIPNNGTPHSTQPQPPQQPPSQARTNRSANSYGNVSTKETTLVRLELCTPTTQAIKIHGAETVNNVGWDSRCSLCGFKLSQRQPPGSPTGPGGKPKWSYDHTLPVNITALFFRIICSHHKYNDYEINIMSHLGDISCSNCNISKGNQRFIHIPINTENPSTPNRTNIRIFLNRLLSSIDHGTLGAQSLKAAIETIDIVVPAGVDKYEFLKNHWIDIQYNNIKRKVELICNVLNNHVDRNKAHANLLANAQDIKICQDIARANSGQKIRSEAFKRILANLAKKSSFPWIDGTSLASDARQEIIIGGFTYGNKPFDTSNTEIYQSFDKASAAGAALSAAVLLAKQITTMGQNAINLALDVDDSKRSINDNYIKAQSLDTRGSTRIYNKNITKFSELVKFFYDKIETTKAEIENIKSNMTRELDILDTLIKGGVTEPAVTQAKTTALEAVDLALSQIERELVDIRGMIQSINDLHKEEAAAAAPRRRKTYGGVRRYKQRKTLKKRRVNKKATRRKGKRQTRRRT